MSTHRKRTKRGAYTRREQRKIKNMVTLLFALCVAAIALMGVVNRLPIGNKYTYTEARDLWIVNGEAPVVAAPEVIVYTRSPEPGPTPEVDSDEAEATPTPEPSPSPEAEQGI